MNRQAWFIINALVLLISYDMSAGSKEFAQRSALAARRAALQKVPQYSGVNAPVVRTRLLQPNFGRSQTYSGGVRTITSQPRATNLLGQRGLRGGVTTGTTAPQYVPRGYGTNFLRSFSGQTGTSAGEQSLARFNQLKNSTFDSVEQALREIQDVLSERVAVYYTVGKSLIIPAEIMNRLTPQAKEKITAKIAAEIKNLSEAIIENMPAVEKQMIEKVLVKQAEPKQTYLQSIKASARRMLTSPEAIEAEQKRAKDNKSAFLDGMLSRLHNGVRNALFDGKIVDEVVPEAYQMTSRARKNLSNKEVMNILRSESEQQQRAKLWGEVFKEEEVVWRVN